MPALNPGSARDGLSGFTSVPTSDGEINETHSSNSLDQQSPQLTPPDSIQSIQDDIDDRRHPDLEHSPRSTSKVGDGGNDLEANEAGHLIHTPEAKSPAYEDDDEFNEESKPHSLRTDYSPEEERKVVRILDRKLVLFLAFLYLLSFLDRSSQLGPSP
jgi:hypothetical protein